MSLRALQAEGRFHAYAYAYPHKTAWRALKPAVPLEQAWSTEDRSALFLYVHVPFCEQRCGFCNLFTQVQPRDQVVADWLATLQRQARLTQAALGEHRFAQLAVGGGTPSYLDERQLHALLDLLTTLGAHGLPASFEASPATLSPAKLDLLVGFGVERLSFGVQSVVEHETGAVHRRQDAAQALRTLSLAAERLPLVNADLIYGLPGQTPASLRASIDAVTQAGARELYLYPLYVRPLTGLGRAAPVQLDQRAQLYEIGRDHLLDAGWEQVTMRCFRLPRAAAPTRYRCQEDGMVGLGPGARSYTRALHWSSPFAVSQSAIRDRVRAWTTQTDAELATATHGFVLSPEEQRRRYVMLGVLEQGLDRDAYHARFHSDPCSDLPELPELEHEGLAAWQGRLLRLTPEGRAASDVIGRWLQSTAVSALCQAWAPT